MTASILVFVPRSCKALAPKQDVPLYAICPVQRVRLIIQIVILPFSWRRPFSSVQLAACAFPEAGQVEWSIKWVTAERNHGRFSSEPTSTTGVLGLYTVEGDIWTQLQLQRFRQRCARH